MKKYIFRRSFFFVLCMIMLLSTAVPASAAVKAAESKNLNPLKKLPTEWDLTELYPDDEAFEKDMKRVEELLPEVEEIKGTLNSAEGFLNLYENAKMLEIKAILDKAELFTYLLSSLDPSAARSKRLLARYNAVDGKYMLACAFKDEEIMSLPFERREEIFSDERLSPYRYELRKYLDPDKVVLGEEAGRVKALMEPAAKGSMDTHDIFEYVELPLPVITLPDGTEEELTEALISRILSDPQYDHEFRKEVLMMRYATRKPYASTYASLLENKMKADWADAQIEGFDSSLKREMHEIDVPLEVYDKIINFAHDMLPKVHEYYAKRKEILGLDEMFFHEISVGTPGYTEKEVSYEDAVNTGRETLSVWGDEYIDSFDRIITSPHIDVYPAKGKETGAFCEIKGNETSPFVLLNFNGVESYTSTIVHEMGHAVYADLSIKNQNVYNNYATGFTHEVTSTANELMLNRAMIENADSDEEKLFWLDKELKLFVTGIMQQCLFSEFEDYCHKRVEGGGSLDADDMADKFIELEKEYYGDAITVPDESGSDWSRIPHFYMNYYMYQYATSITYAASICEQVDEKGQEEIDAYVDFLKAGRSDDPASLLRIAGVDPLDDATYEAAGRLISDLIDQFAELADKQENDDPSEFPMDPSKMEPWINSIIRGMVTDDVNPDLKDDFYISVNHDWLRDAEFKPGYVDVSPYDEAEDLVRERCIDILTDESLTGRDAKIIQNYYNLWLDWDSRNEAGIKPVEPFIKKILAVKDLDGFNELLTFEESRVFGPAFLPVRMGSNSEDSDHYEVKIIEPPLSLGDSAEYDKLTKNGERMKKASEETYRYMLSRFGLNDEEIDDTVKKCFAFESKLAKYKCTSLEENTPEYRKACNNPVTMEEIRKLSPNYPLADYLKKCGWSGSKLINIGEPDLVKGLNKLYTEENLPELKAYFLAHTAGNLITCLDEEAFRKYQEIDKELTGTTDVRSDEDLAYEEAREFFSDNFARIYTDKYLNKEMKDEITDLCREIIDVYDEMLDNEDWLTEETRKKAKEKLKKLRINAVYPDKWEDDSVIHVTAKEDGGSYLTAVEDLYTAKHEMQINKINTTVDKELWLMDPLMTNACYVPSANSINILPGFFCDATYRQDMSREVKLGAIGSVIGHEISHAFDPVGALFDGDGNMTDWWQPEDYEAFEKKAEKVAAYYDKVKPFDDDTHYQGKMVQDEAIADMAGMKCMLLAAKKTKDFDYDKFFRAYTYLWARVSTLEFVQKNAHTNPHPLDYLRVNVTLPQFDEFLDIYDIKEGDGMYLTHEDRIRIW